MEVSTGKSVAALFVGFAFLIIFSIIIYNANSCNFNVSGTNKNSSQVSALKSIKDSSIVGLVMSLILILIVFYGFYKRQQEGGFDSLLSANPYD